MNSLLITIYEPYALFQKPIRASTQTAKANTPSTSALHWWCKAYQNGDCPNKESKHTGTVKGESKTVKLGKRKGTPRFTELGTPSRTGYREYSVIKSPTVCYDDVRLTEIDSTPEAQSKALQLSSLRELGKGKVRDEQENKDNTSKKGVQDTDM